MQSLAKRGTSHEKDLSAEEETEKQGARLSQENADQVRPERAEETAQQGQKAAQQIKRATPETFLGLLLPLDEPYVFCGRNVEKSIRSFVYFPLPAEAPCKPSIV